MTNAPKDRLAIDNDLKPPGSGATAPASRRETIRSMTRRRNGWDYCAPGRYMATLALADRTRPWLGDLPGGSPGASTRALYPGASTRALYPAQAPGGDSTREPPRSGDSARELARGISLTELGRLVAAKWREIAANWPGVEVEDFVVMPDHIHGILHITRRQSHPLGQIVGSFKARSTSAARELARELAGKPAIATVPASLLAGSSLWAPGLTDSILWSEERRQRAVAYVADNPRRLAAKRANPGLFTVRRDIALPMPLGPGGAEIAAHFTAIGNHSLAARLDFHQVQCSRRFFAYRRDRYGNPLKDEPPEVETKEFQLACEQAGDMARAGAVLVNPCISQGEREIARRAFAEGAAMIVLRNKGFSPMYKPEGALFNRCAEGRLLMLAPAAWPFTPGKRPMTREDACALNRIALAIARGGTRGQARGHHCTGEPALRYHGRAPLAIGAAALAAVKGTPL